MANWHRDHRYFISQATELMVSSAIASLALSCRVRSIIMLQEKAQDRERLLLKFIKIMKVTAQHPELSPPCLRTLAPLALHCPYTFPQTASLCSTCAS